jgi:hypothetical protein
MTIAQLDKAIWKLCRQKNAAQNISCPTDGLPAGTEKYKKIAAQFVKDLRISDAIRLRIGRLVTVRRLGVW